MPNRFRGVQASWPRIDGAERPKKGAVAENDRHRDVASESVHGGSCMCAPKVVFGDIIDHDRRPTLPDFLTDRRLDLQLAARLEPKVDFIQYAARAPAVFRDAGYRRKAHTGRAADHLKDGGNRLDAAHRFDILLKIFGHVRLMLR